MSESFTFSDQTGTITLHLVFALCKEALAHSSREVAMLNFKVIVKFEISTSYYPKSKALLLQTNNKEKKICVTESKKKG